MAGESLKISLAWEHDMAQGPIRFLRNDPHEKTPGQIHYLIYTKLFMSGIVPRIISANRTEPKREQNYQWNVCCEGVSLRKLSGVNINIHTFTLVFHIVVYYNDFLGSTPKTTAIYRTHTIPTDLLPPGW